MKLEQKNLVKVLFFSVQTLIWKWDYKKLEEFGAK
jgi:hypothetical protein